MQIASLGSLNRGTQYFFHGIGEGLPCIAAIHQDILHLAERRPMPREGFERTGAIGDVGGRDVDGVRQPRRIHRTMTLDAGHLLAAVVAFFFRGVRVLHTLRVNHDEAGFLGPTPVFADRAHPIFLAPLRGGCRRYCLRVSHSTGYNIRGTSAISENHWATFASGTRFSERTKHRRKPRINQLSEAGFSCGRAPE